MIRLDLDITECEKCPKSSTNKVYTSDSWDDIREVFCKELNRNVYSYLDWNEKSTIPKECPLVIK